MDANDPWADHRLLTACARLSRQDFAATRTSSLSLEATLNHIVTVDWSTSTRSSARYAAAADAEVDRFFDPEEPFAACADSSPRGTGRCPAASACRHLTDARIDMPVAVARRRASNTEARRASSRTCSSTRSTIAGGRTRCSPARRSGRAARPFLLRERSPPARADSRNSGCWREPSGEKQHKLSLKDCTTACHLPPRQWNPSRECSTIVSTLSNVEQRLRDFFSCRD